MHCYLNELILLSILQLYEDFETAIVSYSYVFFSANDTTDYYMEQGHVLRYLSRQQARVINTALLLSANEQC